MKIGIISMQRVHNYGSFMQSYALKRTLEDMGHSCVFLDVVPGKQLVKESQNKTTKSVKKYLAKFDIYFFRRIKNYIRSKKTGAIFETCLKEELGVDEYNTAESCDVVIIGSDEVFNCIQPKSTFGFSPTFFGQGINTDRIISYAASFGYTTFEALVQKGIDKEIAGYFKSFDAISVRDKNSLEIVKMLTGIEPTENVDPVIIGKIDDRIVEPKDDEYIAVYAYVNRIKDPEEIRSIKQFAKKHGLKTIAVGMYQVWCDKNVYGTPFEMVGYIKKAKYVITDTFHGCVFSIKYQKNFAAFVRSQNYYKLMDLLSRFHLESRLIERPEDLEHILKTAIDNEAIIEKINTETTRSITYLSDNLNGDL